MKCILPLLDEDGGITGTAGEILETFAGVSQASDAKDASGNSNYYPDVIYRQSNIVLDRPHLNFNRRFAKKGTTFDNSCWRCICCEILFTCEWYR